MIEFKSVLYLGGGAECRVNNLFDETYASAGRLGINPFSASVNGMTGASGWNYNSNEWHNSTLIGPGSPRAFWAGIEFKY